MNISEWIRQSTAELVGRGIETARLDSLVLLEDAVNKDRSWLIAHPEYQLSNKELDVLRRFVNKRARREPLAYVRGKSEFYGREFVVTPDTLIPRPESETIVELAKQVTTIHDLNTIVDVGTGSGCLAVTLKLELPDLHVLGIDISPEALSIARKNARKYGVSIRWERGDVLKGLPRMPKTRPYAVVANLPYVPDGLITSPEITKEPSMALFSGEDGLRHYRALFSSLGNLPTPAQFVITESLQSQHQAVALLGHSAGYKLAETSDLVQVFIQSA
jgi:release factor glutamine methyltransferase